MNREHDGNALADSIERAEVAENACEHLAAHLIGTLMGAYPPKIHVAAHLVWLYTEDAAATPDGGAVRRIVGQKLLAILTEQPDSFRDEVMAALAANREQWASERKQRDAMAGAR